MAAEVSLFQEIEDSTWTVDDARGVLEGDFGGGLTARLGIGTHRTVESGEVGGRTRSILTIAGIGYDGRTEAGTRGGRTILEIQRGELHRSPKITGGNGSLLKSSALTERSQPIGSQALVRLELSGAWVQGPDALPRPEAAGLGGSANLRGHPEQMFRVLRYGLLRLETGVRMLPEGNRAYLFFDGAIYRPWPRGATKRAGSYGVGFRLRGAGGWVRLDYGIPSGEPSLSGRIHFRLETKF
jgi:hemolysin activation/secretion protein